MVEPRVEHQTEPEAPGGARVDHADPAAELEQPGTDGLLMLLIAITRWTTTSGASAMSAGMLLRQAPSAKNAVNTAQMIR